MKFFNSIFIVLLALVCPAVMFSQENTIATCSDGKDNDGNNLIDLDDPQCLLLIPDQDGDGVMDQCDVCPEGIDSLDTDGDGIPNECEPIFSESVSIPCCIDSRTSPPRYVFSEGDVYSGVLEQLGTAFGDTIYISKDLQFNEVIKITSIEDVTNVTFQGELYFSNSDDFRNVHLAQLINVEELSSSITAIAEVNYSLLECEDTAPSISDLVRNFPFGKNNYTVRFYELTGEEIPTSDFSEYVDQKLKYEVLLEYSNSACGKVYRNSAWGYINVEYKQLPTIAPGDAIYSTCTDYRDEMAVHYVLLGKKQDDQNNSSIDRSVKYLPNQVAVFYDMNCDSILFRWRDVETSIPSGDCSNTVRVVREFQAIDSYNGKPLQFHQVYYLLRPSLDDIQVTEELEIEFDCSIAGIDSIIAAQTAIDYQLSNHRLELDSVIRMGCSDVVYRYDDLVFELCGNGKKIVRTYTFMDMCSNAMRNIVQTIKIIDRTPVLAQLAIDSRVGTNNWSCHHDNDYSLEDLYDIESSCDNYTFTLMVNGYPIASERDSIIPLHLESGDIMTLVTTDDCGNRFIQTDTIDVIDRIAPVMACDDKINVSISNGFAKVLPGSLNAGILDNCGIADLRIRRVGSDTFQNHVEFSCLDVGTSVMLEVEAIDFAGNTNYCMTEVIVDNKTDIQFFCQEDYIAPTISCSEVSSVEPDVLLDQTFEVNAKCGNYEVTYTRRDSINSCGEGRIYYDVSIGDNIYCTRYINVEAEQGYYDIKYVEEITTSCLDTVSFEINDYGCLETYVAHEDIVHETASDSTGCIILRTIGVTDGCSDEIHEYIQKIAVPSITVEAKQGELFDYKIACEDEFKQVVIPEKTISSCNVETVKWLIRSNDDGIKISEGVGTCKATLGRGDYLLETIVTDVCQNNHVFVDTIEIYSSRGDYELSCMDIIENVGCSEGSVTTTIAPSLSLTSGACGSDISYVLQLGNVNLEHAKGGSLTYEFKTEEVYTITWISGSNTCVQTVHFREVDNDPPTLVCASINLQIDTEESISVVPEDVYVVAEDLCSIESFFNLGIGRDSLVDHLEFSCSDTGFTILEVVVVDDHGNSSRCIIEANIMNAGGCATVDTTSGSSNINVSAAAINGELQGGQVIIDGMPYSDANMKLKNGPYSISYSNSDPRSSGVDILDYILLTKFIAGTLQADNDKLIDRFDIDGNGTYGLSDLASLRKYIQNEQKLDFIFEHQNVNVQEDQSILLYGFRHGDISMTSPHGEDFDYESLPTLTYTTDITEQRMEIRFADNISGYQYKLNGEVVLATSQEQLVFDDVPIFEYFYVVQGEQLYNAVPMNIEKEEPWYESVLVTPNPSTGERITVSNSNPYGVTLKIYSLNGEELETVNVAAQSSKLLANKYSEGVYILKEFGYSDRGIYTNAKRIIVLR